MSPLDALTLLATIVGYAALTASTGVALLIMSAPLARRCAPPAESAPAERPALSIVADRSNVVHINTYRHGGGGRAA